MSWKVGFWLSGQFCNLFTILFARGLLWYRLIASESSADTLSCNISIYQNCLRHQDLREMALCQIQLCASCVAFDFANCCYWYHSICSRSYYSCMWANGQWNGWGKVASGVSVRFDLSPVLYRNRKIKNAKIWVLPLSGISYLGSQPSVAPNGSNPAPLLETRTRCAFFACLWI